MNQPLARRRRALAALGIALVTLLIVLGWSATLLMRGPLREAQANMRLARFDLAVAALNDAPGWIDRWPSMSGMRRKAELGLRFRDAQPEWQKLGVDLRALLEAKPDDPDLLVLEASFRVHEGDWDAALERARDAADIDPANAEAWFLVGLSHQAGGNSREAVRAYRRAIDASPESPEYHSNLARALLDEGEIDEAIDFARKVKQMPIARVEEALGHWARGEWNEAGEAQRAALAMLEEPSLQQLRFNRWVWTFRVGRKLGVLVPTQRDKRCYAEVEEAASARLAGFGEARFPPDDCATPPQNIRLLVASDLCRFVIRQRPEPDVLRRAKELRAAIGEPNQESCGETPPGPSPHP